MAKQDDEAVRKRLMREAAEEALAEAADKDPAVSQWLDDDFEKGMTQIMGMSPSQLQEELNGAIPGISQREIDAAIRDAQAARRAIKGGFFSDPNPELAAKIMKKNGKLVKLHNAKKSKSCFIAGLVLISGGLTTLAGIALVAAEALSAVFS